MTLIEEIKSRLASLSPITMDIEDESALHAGHIGNTGGGHFKLAIKSAQFNELSQVARHRMVYALVNELIPNKIHALSIEAKGSDE